MQPVRDVLLWLCWYACTCTGVCDYTKHCDSTTMVVDTHHCIEVPLLPPSRPPPLGTQFCDHMQGLACMLYHQWLQVSAFTWSLQWAIAPNTPHPRHDAAVASQLADLAADCIDISRRRRPDLATVVRPRLQQLAEEAAQVAPGAAPSVTVPEEPPAEYLCPISRVSLVT
jgi:hypothetical protein